MALIHYTATSVGESDNSSYLSLSLSFSQCLASVINANWIAAHKLTDLSHTFITFIWQICHISSICTNGQNGAILRFTIPFRNNATQQEIKSTSISSLFIYFFLQKRLNWATAVVIQCFPNIINLICHHNNNDVRFMQCSVRLVQAPAATLRIQRVPGCLVEMLQPRLQQKTFFSRAKIQGSGIQLSRLSEELFVYPY